MVFDTEVCLANEGRSMRRKKRSKSAEVEAVDRETEVSTKRCRGSCVIAEEPELFRTPRGEGYASVPVRGNTDAKASCGANDSVSPMMHDVGCP